MLSILEIMDLLGVAVFAISGALVASRKEMDLVSFGLLASLTGIGGGTLRDLILDRPVFWVETPYYIVICLSVAVIVYFTAHVIHRRFVLVLWADAIGLSAYCVMGAEVALRTGANELVAVVMGVMTATFGGLARDTVCAEPVLIMRKELYATCAMVGAGVHVGLGILDVSFVISVLAGFFAAFGLRAGGLTFGWTLPPYKPRPGVNYD